jgi:hypothetical protein
VRRERDRRGLFADRRGFRFFVGDLVRRLGFIVVIFGRIPLVIRQGLFQHGIFVLDERVLLERLLLIDVCELIVLIGRVVVDGVVRVLLVILGGPELLEQLR